MGGCVGSLVGGERACAPAMITALHEATGPGQGPGALPRPTARALAARKRHIRSAATKLKESAPRTTATTLASGEH